MTVAGIAEQIRVWLNEEWEPLDAHQQLGNETAKIYVQLRQGGENDLGSVLLDLGAALCSFDFSETYTGQYDVANKVAELLMIRMGKDVCCVDDSERRRIENTL